MGYNFHKLTNGIKEYFIKQGICQTDVPQAAGFKYGKVIMSDTPPSKFKEFITNSNCEFCKKLNALFEIERIEAFPDEPDDPEVIVIFRENLPLSCILFSNSVALVEIIFKGRFFNIPFLYEQQAETDGFNDSTDFLETTYKNYGSKGMEKLFDDILHFLDDVKKQIIYLDYLNSFKSVFNNSVFFEKCRIYSTATNETIACGKKWKDKYIKKFRLKSICISGID